MSEDRRFQTEWWENNPIIFLEKHKFMVNKEKSSILAILGYCSGFLKLTLPDLLPGLNPEGVLWMQVPHAVGRDSSHVRVVRFQYKFQCYSVLSPHHQPISDTSLVSHNPDTLSSEKLLQIPQVQGSGGYKTAPPHLRQAMAPGSQLCFWWTH